jgi:hypothetical protein
MKRMFLAGAACLGLAVGMIAASSPADARVSVGIYFGYPGPYYGYPYYPGPYPYYAPRPYYPRHQVCYPVVKVKKYVRKHRVHFKRVVVTVCRWQYGW